MSTAPALSVILATDTYATIEPVIERLLGQTIRERIELVIVTASEPDFDLDRDASSFFAHVSVIEHDPTDLPAARAAGVRAASAPLVFIGETHTYPHPTWAETLVRAHEGDWAVVVPGFGNANPDNTLSWAAFLCDYGRWQSGLSAGPTEMIPIYNSAYKREVLIDLDPGLETLLSPSDRLVLRLSEQGRTFYFEPAARIDHVNVSSWRTWLVERYLGGLTTATSRRRGWRWPRRAFYVAASPLIPVVLLWRLRGTFAAETGRRPRGTRAAVWLSTCIYGFGELVGYALGASEKAEARMTEIEIHRLRYIALR